MLQDRRYRDHCRRGSRSDALKSSENICAGRRMIGESCQDRILDQPIVRRVVEVILDVDRMRLELFSGVTDHLEIFAGVSGPLSRGLMIAVSNGDIAKV
jgi:hypothetical protein